MVLAVINIAHFVFVAKIVHYARMMGCAQSGNDGNAGCGCHGKQARKMSDYR
jgi:hypothetical protein